MWTVSAVTAIYDKLASKKYPQRRIRERTLILQSLFGGGPISLLTMLAIRHKTKHTKMMVFFWISSILWCAVYALGLAKYFGII
jgi:uncharacterized membrane protein YsdA (DUF1294 family)